MQEISVGGTADADGVPADADADGAALALRALNIVTCAVDARVADENAELRAQNRALRARLTDWGAGAIEPKVGEFYQFSDPGLYHFHVSRRHDMLRETSILSGEILGAHDGWHRLVSDRFPLSGPVYRYLGHRSETEFEYPCAARKRIVKARSHLFELPVAAATVPCNPPIQPEEISDGGFVTFEVRDSALHWLELVEEPRNLIVFTGDPGRYGDIPAWLAFGPRVPR